MKKANIILEIGYGILLWGFFWFYIENKDDFNDNYSSSEFGYNFDHDVASSLFAGLLLIILVAEWVRRRQRNSDRSRYEKYLYLPAMFCALIFAIFYVNSLVES